MFEVAIIDIGGMRMMRLRRQTVLVAAVVDDIGDSVPNRVTTFYRRGARKGGRDDVGVVPLRCVDRRGDRGMHAAVRRRRLCVVADHGRIGVVVLLLLLQPILHPDVRVVVMKAAGVEEGESVIELVEKIDVAHEGRVDQTIRHLLRGRRIVVDEIADIVLVLAEIVVVRIGRCSGGRRKLVMMMRPRMVKLAVHLMLRVLRVIIDYVVVAVVVVVGVAVRRDGRWGQLMWLVRSGCRRFRWQVRPGVDDLMRPGRVRRMRMRRGI